MTRAWERQTSGLLTCCIRLLYWSYLKPYTFNEYLCALHPYLSATISWIWLADRFPNNAALEEYRLQANAIVRAAPLVAIAFCGTILTLGQVPFNWLPTITYSLGYTTGAALNMHVTAEDPGQARKWHLAVGLGAVFWAIALTVFGELLKERLVSSFTTYTGSIYVIGVPFSELDISHLVMLFAVGIGSGVAFGVAFGQLIGVSVAIAGGLAVGLVLNPVLGAHGAALAGFIAGAILGSAFSVVFGLRIGLVVGLITGVAAGTVGMLAVDLEIGLTIGVASTVGTLVGTLRLITWLLMVLWMILLRWLASGARAGDALHLLPTNYSESVVLPIPLLGRFLVDAYSTNKIGTCLVLERLNSHPHQHAAAHNAQKAIITTALRRCAHTADIGHVSEALNSVVQLGINKLDAPLLGLLDISRSVKAATLASSTYRIKNEYELQLRELRNVAASLSKADVAVANKYGSIVNSWESILQSAVRTLAQQGIDSEIPSVYIVGPHLRPESAEHLFVGRRDLVREIEKMVASPHPSVVVMQGQHRTGKTSLMAFLPVRLPADWIPLLVDVQGIAVATSCARLAFEMVSEIIDRAGKVRPAEAKAIKRPQLGEFRDEPFLTISDWLKYIAQTLPQRKFLLCFDEFEHLEESFDVESRRNLLTILQKLSEHDPRWALMFASSNSASQMAPYWRQSLGATHRLKISYLEPADTRCLIEQPIPDFAQHMTYEPSAVEEIVRLTHGQPYLVQLVCSELVSLLNAEKRRRVTRADVETVIPIAFEHGGSYFDEFWFSLKDAQRAVLSNIARGDTVRASREHVDDLVRREIVELTKTGIAFQVPLLGRWVLEHGIDLRDNMDIVL